MKKYLLLAMTATTLTACVNMPTQSSQITGTYTSEIKYEKFSCSKLAAEINSISRRENQLTVAQDQRYKSSQMQAFWWGIGQGDGIEASELASVRGEKETILKVMETKKCQISN